MTKSEMYDLRNRDTAATQPSWSGPKWLGPGFCFVGGWEPLVFRRRRGGLRTDEVERFHRENSDASTQQLRALGVDLVVIPFDKGFGATAQAEDVERSRKWSAKLHAAGIKVGAYVRYDNLVPETISQDLPHVEDWIARTGQGQPAAILNQSYRVAAQPTNEQHIAYVEHLITRAVDELEADMIHLDGFWTQNLAWSDTSEGTVSAFRAFLAAKYAATADAIERFGHARTDLISPPVFREPDMGLDALEKVSDPVVQEWLLFRTQLTAQLAERFARTCEEAAVRVGREVAFSANSLIPIGYANGLYWGFEVDKNGPHLDAQWTEDDHWPALRDDGVIVSRIREFKIGAAVGTRVFSYQRALSERQLEVSIAQALVFNDGVIGMLGSPLVGEERFYEIKASAMTWARAHIQPLAGNRSGADVAVWRSSRALMFEATRAHRSVILAEQMLIQGRVPFDIVFDDVFDRLDRYRVLVLPDTMCMNEAQVEAVRRFVSEGGGVVATGRASMYDEYFRLRPTPAFMDVFGPELRYDEGDFWHSPEISLAGSASSSTHTFGDGRSVYFPAIVTARQPDYTGTLGEQPYRFPTEEWQVPLMTEEFLNAIAWVRGSAKPLDVAAPPGIVADLQAGSDGEVIVHLVDYDLQRSGGAHVAVAVRAPGAKAMRVFPFGEEPQELTPMEENGIVFIDLIVNVSTSVVLS